MNRENISLRDVHKRFEEFYYREDIKEVLDKLPKTKHVQLLQRVFQRETGLPISTSYIYKLRNNQIPQTKLITIGKHSYEVEIIEKKNEEKEEEEDNYEKEIIDKVYKNKYVGYREIHSDDNI
jgi:hypothetical protein